MVRVTPLSVDQSSDTAHVIYNEDSEDDQVIVQTLCGDMDRSGIPTTYYQRDGREGGLEIRDRGSMMEKAFWVIIIYLQTPAEEHDVMFAFEENMTLFLAITRDVQNVIYLLGCDVDPIVSKGFPYLRMKKDRSWLGRLTGLVKTTPSKITCNLLYRFCYQLVQQQSAFSVTRESLSLWASLFSPTCLTLAWKLQGSSGSQAYIVTFKNGSLVIKRSEIEDNDESAGLATRTSLSGNSIYMNTTCDVADADPGDNRPADSHPQGTGTQNINWTNVSTIKPSLIPNESVCTTVAIIIMQIIQCIFFLGIGVMLGQCTFPVVAGVDESTPYTAEVQIALVVISFLLSAVNVFRSVTFMSTELSWMTCYQLLVALVSVVMQGLFTADLLPFPVDMAPRIGGIAAFGIINIALVSDFIASNARENKCRLFVRVLSLILVILVVAGYCTMSQLRYREEGVALKETLIITVIHFVSQYGLFKCIMKYIRYVIRLFCKRKIGIYVEQVFLVIYALIWFMPILYFY